MMIGLVESVPDAWAYVLLFVACLLENLFPPFPGDTVLLFGACLAGRGQLAFIPVYGVTVAGSISGFLVLFCLGRRLGARMTAGQPGRIFRKEHMDRVHAWFEKYGYGVIAVNRFLSGFRGVVSLAAGMAGMDGRKVAGLAFLSVLVWNAVLVAAGAILGPRIEYILARYQRVVFCALSLVIIGMTARALIRHRRRLKKR